jgi:hypothetical protein
MPDETQLLMELLSDDEEEANKRATDANTSQ